MWPFCLCSINLIFQIYQKQRMKKFYFPYDSSSPPPNISDLIAFTSEYLQDFSFFDYKCEHRVCGFHEGEKLQRQKDLKNKQLSIDRLSNILQHSACSQYTLYGVVVYLTDPSIKFEITSMDKNGQGHTALDTTKPGIIQMSFEWYYVDETDRVRTGRHRTLCIWGLRVSQPVQPTFQ